jgi:hypothetical protein
MSKVFAMVLLQWDATGRKDGIDYEVWLRTKQTKKWLKQNKIRYDVIWDEFVKD